MIPEETFSMLLRLNLSNWYESRGANDSYLWFLHSDETFPMQYGSFITFVSDEYVRFDKTVLEVVNLRLVLDRTVVEQLIITFFFSWWPCLVFLVFGVCALVLFSIKEFWPNFYFVKCHVILDAFLILFAGRSCSRAVKTFPFCHLFPIHFAYFANLISFEDDCPVKFYLNLTSACKLITFFESTWNQVRNLHVWFKLRQMYETLQKWVIILFFFRPPWL